MAAFYVHGLIFLVVAWFVPAGAAQDVGRCVPAQADAFLEVGQVRARLYNDGRLFADRDNMGYEVPRGQGVSAMGSADLWIAGKIDSKLRIASGRYGIAEFWPGPLDEASRPPSECQPYDRLWEVTREDIETYFTTGQPSANLRAWPWHLGAPVVEGDGDPTNYNLEGGDLPALVGDQMVWWVMNDAGNEHVESQSVPLGLEVQGTAFGFRVGHPFAYTTFYRYRLRYKGAAPLRDAYVGFYVQAQVGSYFDDYIGSDSTLHLAFAYNGDNDDESDDEEENGYGEAPPAVGLSFLRGARSQPDQLDNDRDGTTDEPGERLGLTAFLQFPNLCGVAGCFFDAPLYYNYLQGRWRDGRPMTVGGTRYESTSDEVTTFMFSGDPTTGAFWSEMNFDGEGTSLQPGYREFVMGSGPFTLMPGEEEEILLAIVWARAGDYLAAVRELKQHVAVLHSEVEQLLTPDIPARPSTPAPPLGVVRNYPNPFLEATTIEYLLPATAFVRLAVYDVRGREVARLVDGVQTSGRHSVRFTAESLPAGVYFYHIQIGSSTAVYPMLHVL